MTKRSVLKIIATLSAVFVPLGSVTALPDYLKLFAADPLSRPELRTKCSVCHVNSDGGGARNEFGKAFAAAGHKITDDLRERFPDRFVQQEPVPNLPVTFPRDSQTRAIIELNGKRYLINTRDHTVTLIAPDAFATAVPPVSPKSAKDDHIFEPVDVRVVNLPSALSIPKGSLWVDFTHRFPFNEVTETALLLGLDGFAIPSFGFTYGITDRIHAGAYRSPTTVGRPIAVFVGASLLEEKRGNPFNLEGRVSLEGRDNFQRNFAGTFELAFARSITRHAQIYVVPSVTVGDRPLAIGPDQNYKGRTAPALGFGLAVNVRPSVQLLAEANMRLSESARYIGIRPEFGRGIHRPVVGFGIEKVSASRRHTFSLTFSNGPGTTPAQRSMTRGLLFSDDSFGGMSIGFNLTRRLF
ncbi:MAG: DUF5777 family beta-barrel protein [Acidobacteriota bacterium]